MIDPRQVRALIQALNLKKLTLEQVQQLDRLLASLGEYGEVHLVVQHGELRYMNKVESYKAWKNDQDQNNSKLRSA